MELRCLRGDKSQLQCRQGPLCAVLEVWHSQGGLPVGRCVLALGQLREWHCLELGWGSQLSKLGSSSMWSQHA